MTQKRLTLRTCGREILWLKEEAGPSNQAIAVQAAQHGFTVFAMVRKKSDAQSLWNLYEPNLIPICPLDLTHLDAILGVVETVAIEMQRPGKKGQYALIQACLPLIRQAGDKIVWIMTPATIHNQYVPSIHACDFATNGIARTLDIEL